MHFSGRRFTVCFHQILKVCGSDSRLLVPQRLFSLAYPLPALNVWAWEPRAGLGAAALAPIGNFKKLHILRLHPDLLNQTLLNFHNVNVINVTFLEMVKIKKKLRGAQLLC